jgi:hypothetical protein
MMSVFSAALGLAPSAAPAETPQSAAPHAAPQAWLDYVRLVSEQVTAWMGGDDAAAVRLHDYLNQLPGAAEPDGVTLRLTCRGGRSVRLFRLGFCGLFLELLLEEGELGRGEAHAAADLHGLERGQGDALQGVAFA